MYPSPPYYAVIFTSEHADAPEGYAETAEAMLALAARQPGFLGVDHARDRMGITISYWSSLEAIAAWKQQADHRVAQQKGKDLWYRRYTVRICRVEREYSFNRTHSGEDLPGS